MHKKIVLTLFILVFIGLPSDSYYDMTTPVEGSSIANDVLQFNVIEKIYQTLSPKLPTCSDYKIKNTQVLHYPYDVKKKKNKYVEGYWKELWTVDACGQYKQLPVTFYIKKNYTNFEIDKYFLQE